MQLPLNQAMPLGAAAGLSSRAEIPLDEPIASSSEILPGTVFEPSVTPGEIPLDAVPDTMSPIVIAPEVYLDTEEPDANSSVWLRNLSFTAGMHGFRGPSDLNRLANFGFHEGVNWGLPLLPFWNLGGQIGARGVHSNFSNMNSGSGTEDFGTDRNQLFLTGGMFTRRVDGGWQTGTAYDFFHDSNYSHADLTQVRTEIAYVFGSRFEIGFWGAYGANSHTVTVSIFQHLVTKLEPTDLYTLFYRHHFTGGGQGRLWGGITGDKAAVFGGEATVPLGTNWSIHNNFTYRVAKSDAPVNDGSNESWAVSIGLIWYPWRLARNVYRDPYHPLFDVADNAVFLINRGPTTLGP